VGPILVDAKGVSRLYRGRVRSMDLMMLVGAAVLTMIIALSLSPLVRLELQLFWTQVQNSFDALREAIFS
jgi:uncharacterized membrane-anchored protein